MYIYIHIPFCSHICHYCDFPKILYDPKYILNYLDSLKEEIKSRYQGEPVKTIYIGGGTPTSLTLQELEYLLQITQIFHLEDKIEFTIESNIECLTEEKILLLKQYGINRISLGVQSFQKDTLKELGRNHTKEMILDVIKKIKENHIENISIDYIYGVNSNLEEIKQDMNTFLELDIPHISCYSLIIENGTKFGIEKREYIEEEIEYQMYLLIEKILKENRYHHYEISNYSKPGYESIHNLNYWNNEPYYGFGLGAVSFLDHHRITNTKNFTKYLEKDYIANQEYEDISIRISNELILGLRKVEGISIHHFYQKYKQDILSLYDIQSLIQEGKLEVKNQHLRIIPKYFYLANDILIHFL